MKTTHAVHNRHAVRHCGRQSKQAFVAVVVVLALMSLLLIFVMMNVRTVYYLKRNVKVVEQRQIHRLEANQATNILDLSSNSVPTNTTTHVSSANSAAPN